MVLGAISAAVLAALTYYLAKQTYKGQRFTFLAKAVFGLTRFMPIMLLLYTALCFVVLRLLPPDPAERSTQQIAGETRFPVDSRYADNPLVEMAGIIGRGLPLIVTGTISGAFAPLSVGLVAFLSAYEHGYEDARAVGITDEEQRHGEAFRAALFAPFQNLEFPRRLSRDSLEKPVSSPTLSPAVKEAARKASLQNCLATAEIVPPMSRWPLAYRFEACSCIAVKSVEAMTGDDAARVEARGYMDAEEVQRLTINPTRACVAGMAAKYPDIGRW